ncbi:hypothetical protein MACH10_00190 [Thalassospira tepidiphila]|uniref:ImmA/IrrE family metallo-endopeptidase n=1 Tax=Thalassospira tepidiphila TaxID=393657 RepID=UPI00291CDE02|nr:hypothetical protein MACH10_00190 [Thalassospira tepidiphila]
MNPAFRIKMAKRRGEQIAKEQGVNTLPVDPFEIAEDHNIMVQAKPNTETGVSGMLLRHGDTFGILYATHIPSLGFQRFSVAHELGHYFIDGHPEHIFPEDGVHESRAGFVSSDIYELEADNFAAGLLMPGQLFKREMNKHSAGLDAILLLADKCVTSLTATAIRFAELSEDAIAVIVSTGPNVDYCMLSETMKLLPGLSFIRKGSAVPTSTLTAVFNRDPEAALSARRDEQSIDIQDWLGGSKSKPAHEEVIGLGGYGKTLTIVTCPGLVEAGYEDDDDDDEEDLEARWTPKFHR